MYRGLITRQTRDRSYPGERSLYPHPVRVPYLAELAICLHNSLMAKNLWIAAISLCRIVGRVTRSCQFTSVFFGNDMLCVGRVRVGVKHTAKECRISFHGRSN
jgi:hypothetical protein